jgi:hypothetical protein
MTEIEREEKKVRFSNEMISQIIWLFVNGERFIVCSYLRIDSYTF